MTLKEIEKSLLYRQKKRIQNQLSLEKALSQERQQDEKGRQR